MCKFPKEYIDAIFIQIDQHLKKLLPKYKGVPILWNTVYSVSAQETAKHRAKFGWPPVSDVSCSNEGKTRNPLKLAGVPQTNEPISAASGPKFTML